MDAQMLIVAAAAAAGAMVGAAMWWILARARAALIRAEEKLLSLEGSLAEARSERDAARHALAAAEVRVTQADLDAALARQAVGAMEKRMADWEAAKQESLTHAKAAVLSTAQELSSKLLADHKRETDQARRVNEERLAKATQTLTDRFEGITKSVASLSSQVSRNQETVDTVWRALSSPAGAGNFSEISLENTLKSFGLVRDRDFALEHTISDSVDGSRLRPDALVFLPYDSVLVIDSKASKFLLELAEAEGDATGEEAAYANLARTMNQHLRALAGKDYQRAVLDWYRAAGRAGDIRRTIPVMYLPNEGALERLNRADPKFTTKAAQHGIIISGPTGLASIIGFARIEIDLGRQAENQERIVTATQQLLESLGTVVGHVETVGRGIRNAANSYVKLTGSLNSRLLPRARGLVSLGVRPAGSKSLPKQLSGYQIVDLSETIDGEAEEVSALPALEERRPAPRP